MILDIQWMTMAKWLILSLFLVVIAIKDIQEYRIPNKVLLLAFYVRIIIFITELLMNKVKVNDFIVKTIVVVAILIAGIIINIVTHNGIGFGDIKLFIIVALYVNINDILGIIINSIFIMGIITIILLVIRRKSRKDIVPFAPAILLAVIVKGVSCYL